ncbi:MAG: radical SAM protein [Alistipes indistinctus]
MQDGCDYHCSYCTIPLARGAAATPPVADLVREAEAIAAKGQREIVLTGINVGDFRPHYRGNRPSICCVRWTPSGGIDRYRISSIEPNLLTDEVIAFTAGSG